MSISRSTQTDDTRSFSSPGTAPDGSLAPRSFLLLVLQCDRPLLRSIRISLSALNSVRLGRGSERAYTQSGRELTLRLADSSMSATHAQLLRVVEGWVIEDRGSKNGVMVNGKRTTRIALRDRDVIELGDTFFLFRTGVVASGELPTVEERPEENPRTAQLTTLTCPFAQELRALKDLASTSVPLLLTGETGTGKEVLARNIHMLARPRGPFIAVNCGGMPENLFESELFGYRRGSFSGATEDRPGLIRSADHGTLFLDEVGDLPSPSQASLLRVLQDREVLPLGATQTVPVDFRLIAATNRDLQGLVERGQFRADLFARLSGHALQLPALRERREDIGLLIRELLPRVAANADEISLHRNVVCRLFAYAWPYNIRELEHCLRTAAAVAREGKIRLEHLPKAIVSEPTSFGDAAPSSERALSADEVRREELARLLQEHDGNVSAVARVLGKARAQVHRWIKRYGLKRLSGYKID